jgi:hypothetical protein
VTAAALLPIGSQGDPVSLELTSTTLLVLVGTLALLMPVLGVGLWHRSVRLGKDSLGRNVGRWLGIVLGQLLAVGVTFLVVNNIFSFYTSWDDVFGAGIASTSSIKSQG